MMKRVAIVGVLAVVSALVVGPALAQGQGRLLGGGQQAVTLLLALPSAAAARLELTGEQKTKLEGIRTAMVADLQKAFPAGGAGGGGNIREAVQKAQETLRKAEADAEALLTPAQKTQFDALKTDFQGYAGAGRSGLALLAVTDLKDDQKSQLKALATETQAKRRGLFQGGGGGGNGLQKLQQAETDAQAAVRKILTADQAKQFDDALKALPQIGGRLGRPRGNQP